MSLPSWLFPRIRSFWYGFTLPVAAVQLILSRANLLFWSALPIVITFAVYTYVISDLQGFARLKMTAYLASLGMDPTGWAIWSFSLLIRLVLIAVSILTFSLLSGIVAAPLNDVLAEKVEPWATPPLPPLPRSRFFLSYSRIRIIWIDTFKTLTALFISVIALISSWIPILNFFALLTFFLIVTFQYISYPQTRRGLGLLEGFLFVKRHFFACVGFGAAASLGFSVPFFSAFFLPVAVVSGTLLYAKSQDFDSRHYLK